MSARNEGTRVSGVQVSAAHVGGPELDLRAVPRDDVLRRVEKALDVRLRREGEVRKRRSIGAATDRGTWVRIEMRRLEKMAGQGFNGPEAAAVLTGIAKSAWHTSVAWSEPRPASVAAALRSVAWVCCKSSVRVGGGTATWSTSSWGR